MEVHVVEPMNNPHLCHHGHYVFGSIGHWEEWLWKETDCLQNGLSCWLDYWTYPQLKSPFDEHLHVTQVSSDPVLIWGDWSTYSSLVIFWAFFSFMFFPRPWPLITALVGKQLNIWLFLLTRKIYDHVYVQSFANCEDFPLTVSFWAVPEKGYNAEAFLCYMVPT